MSEFGDLEYAEGAAAYAAATASAAVMDLTDRAHVELTGRDRQSFLHNFCTNDIKRLKPGEGCEAFLSSLKGRILGHVLVLCREDRLLLDSVAGSDDFLIPHLDRYLITEDVSLTNRSSELADLFVTGPAAAAAIQQALGINVDGLAMYGHCAAVWQDSELILCRAPFAAAPGFLLASRSDSARRLWDSFIGQGVVPAPRDVFETLRIEAGFPWFGVDLSDDLMAQEAGRTQQAISFTKGCYLGQEPIARLDSLGHANRMLRGLKFDAGAVPAAGDSVFDEAVEQVIGTVSSAALSPAENNPVALALLKAKHATPGTRVALKHTDNTPHPATVFWPS